ncbi:hypothetical protein [Pseudomonas sp. NPDC089406]
MIPFKPRSEKVKSPFAEFIRNAKSAEKKARLQYRADRSYQTSKRNHG